jgi:hypothetical protein
MDPRSVVWADLVWLSRLLLGSAFVVAGAAKLLRWRRFRDTLAATELLPPGLTGAAAGLLPPAEVTLGAAVLGGWWLPVSGSLLLALLAGFVLALAVYRARGGTELACGCFADFEHTTATAELIVRNLLLLVAGLPLLAATPAPAHRGWDEWLMGGTAVLGVALAWTLTTRLAGAVAALYAAPAEVLERDV